MENLTFYQYNPWWEDDAWQDSYAFIKRSYFQEKIFSHINSKSRSILFLTGLRRVGKTSLMKISIQKLIKEGTEPSKILYISMDDYTLKDVSILDVINQYKSIQRIKYEEPCYIFLDEITYKADFRQQLKNLYDNTTNKIIVSASSSSALRDQKGWLTGRELVLEVHPLYFNEYLDFKEITIKQRDANLLPTYFEDYMQTGGMPEYVLTGDRAYLVGLIGDIISKDIVAYHGIKNHRIIIDYFVLLMERAGKQISINKISKILDISPDTASRYLQMFVDTYLISLMPRYGKTNEQILSPKKIYVADLGIKNVITGFRDKGAIFENYVYLLIKHLDPRYIYENETELDFITKDKTLIEVKYNQVLDGKQKQLFETFHAVNKILISNFAELEQLNNLQIDFH